MKGMRWYKWCVWVANAEGSLSNISEDLDNRIWSHWEFDSLPISHQGYIFLGI